MELMTVTISGHVIALKFWAKYYLAEYVYNFSEKRVHIFYCFKDSVTVLCPQKFKNL